MRVAERPCEVCGARIDPAWTSAHFARVLWLCTAHGEAFHESENLGWIATAGTTDRIHAAIDAWVRAQARPTHGEVRP